MDTHLDTYEKAFIEVLREHVEQAKIDLTKVKKIMEENEPKDDVSLLSLRDALITANISEAVEYAVNAAMSAIALEQAAAHRNKNTSFYKEMPFYSVYLAFRKYFNKRYVDRISETIEEYISDTGQVSSFVCGYLKCILTEIIEIDLLDPDEKQYKVYALYADAPAEGVAIIAARDAKEANEIIRDLKKESGSNNDYAYMGEVAEECLVKDMYSDRAGILVNSITGPLK